MKRTDVISPPVPFFGLPKKNEKDIEIPKVEPIEVFYHINTYKNLD